ncbi:hypothetical protein QJS10_CPA03g00864 [Acorus calamus]|uniref:Uncharacterized protein n=1 Tax=Acorus calamus TaxID=4465 RepID=A0AAV9F7N4_ACOCL|nr:hypothetical protein QJS10_CPA03g00864 [Acorus calamus]
MTRSRARNNHLIDGDRGVQELFRPLWENQQPLREEFRQQTRQTLCEVKVGVNLNTDNRRPGCDRMRAEGFARGQPVAYNGVRRNSHYLPDYEDDLDDESVESEIDEDMANKEVEDVVLSVESENIIGGEQEKLFSYSLVVIPEIEKPLQAFVLQTTCHINMSDFDVIVNNNIATTTVVDLIEKEFKIKKMSLLLPKVQYKDASNKMEEKVLISPIGVYEISTLVGSSIVFTLR